MMNSTCFTALLALIGTVVQIGTAIEMIAQGTPLPLIILTFVSGLLTSYLTLATVATILYLVNGIAFFVQHGKNVYL